MLLALTFDPTRRGANFGRGFALMLRSLDLPRLLEAFCRPISLIRASSRLALCSGGKGQNWSSLAAADDFHAALITQDVWVNIPVQRCPRHHLAHNVVG